MIRKNSKVVSLFLAVIMVLSLPLSVYAAASTATFSVSTALGRNEMMTRGWKGTNVKSNEVYFDVNLSNKKIKSITVKIGTSTSSGTIVGNTMHLENIDTGCKGSNEWKGGNNTSVVFNTKNSDFVSQIADGTYKLWYEGTVISNTLGNPIFNIPDSEAIRGYKGSEIKLVIEYE